MTDPPGLEHPLGIETVRWSVGNGADLLVSVAGHWRRRRTAATVLPVLAIDTEHGRHRFPAMPEPPSVRGAQPGLWQVGFTVPASLAPYLAGRLTLLLGSVAISLPPAVVDPVDHVPPAFEQEIPAGPDPIVVTDLRNRHSATSDPEGPGGAEEASTENGDARGRLERLERELADARHETERLRTKLEGAERKRRAAEEFAHSEAAMRLEHERDQAERIARHQADASAVLELLHAVQLHARDIAREIETVRRSADEAGQPSDSGSAGHVGEGRPGAHSLPRALVAEIALARSTPAAPVRAVPAALPGTRGLSLELAMHEIHAARIPRARSTTVAAADRAPGRLEHKPPAGSTLEAKLVGAPSRLTAERAEADLLAAGEPTSELELAKDRARAAYVMDAIEAIGRQLDAVRAVVALLPPARAGEVARVPPGARQRSDAHPIPPDQASGAVAPDRLTAALDRLREEYSAAGSGAAAAPNPGAPPLPATADHPATATPPPAEPHDAGRAPEASAAPNPAGRPSENARWLVRAMKRLLREDPAAVGRIVIHLLPAQSLAVAGPVRYDIVLGDAGCRAVTVHDDEVALAVLSAPRPLGEVDFRIEGDLAELGRLLTYGSLRRRLSRRVARVRGDRRPLAALDRLVREPHGLRELHAAGVRLDPELALLLVAGMIDPSWTAGERFTVGHESPEGRGRVYLLVRDGSRPRVSSQPPLGPVATTIRCPDGHLLTLLSDGSGGEGDVRGGTAPLALLREWIARAQRDS